MADGLAERSAAVAPVRCPALPGVAQPTGEQHGQRDDPDDAGGLVTVDDRHPIHGVGGHPGGHGPQRLVGMGEDRSGVYEPVDGRRGLVVVDRGFQAGAGDDAEQLLSGVIHDRIEHLAPCCDRGRVGVRD